MNATGWVLIVGAVAAGFVQGLSGFAFGVVATSIWAWWLPPQRVAPMSVFGALTDQVVAMITTHRRMQWPRLAPLLAGGLCGLSLGVGLLPKLDAATFQLGVGAPLAVWCPVMLMSGPIPHVTRGGRSIHRT
jgi:uncharacterized membrane protein YfcA